MTDTTRSCCGTSTYDDCRCPPASNTDELAARAREPVAWCSPGQLANLTGVDRDGGVYLPIRKTKRGNFTMPLFATPQSDGTAIPAGKGLTSGEGAVVEKIETVPLLHPFDDAETPPLWRVRVGEYCADFDFEQAARNFAGAINRLAASPASHALPDWGEGLPIDDGTCRCCSAAPRSPETLLCASCEDEGLTSGEDLFLPNRPGHCSECGYRSHAIGCSHAASPATHAGSVTTAPKVASDTMREAGEQFAENAKNLPGIDPATLARAKAHVAAMAIVNADPIAAFAALSIQSPAAGQDGEGVWYREALEQISGVVLAFENPARCAVEMRDIARRALNPTKDAQS